MQLQTVTTYSSLGPGFDFIADDLAIVQAGGYVRLLFAARSDSRLSSLLLADGFSAPVPAADDPVIGGRAGGAIAVQDNGGSARIFVFSGPNSILRHASAGSTALPGLTNGVSTDQGYLQSVTGMAILERGSADIAVIAQQSVPGLRLFSIGATGVLTLLSTIEDGPKSYLADVADLMALEISGRSYLLAASALENGLTIYEIGPDGGASFVDALGVTEGLPVAGPAALQSVLLAGRTYVVMASTLSSSLTVIRVNDMGVLFAEDHLIDSRDTRFDHVAALDMFSHAGRVFIVAAGTDAGVTVLELLPDGQLSVMLSQALETGAGIAAVTGIETAVLGTSVAILLTDAGGDRIYHFAVSLAGIGGLISASGGLTVGTALDDRIIGSAAAETLQGGAGDDFVHDGGGGDLLTGGAGADVFVFDRDGSADRIGDFQPGIDRIDVSAWGRIYSAASLTITATATGATLGYGGETLVVTSAGGGTLTLTETDFLF